ncbi:unnamed protein product [Lampetra fluviatilis]
MDPAAIDYLTMEKLLGLAQEKGIVLPIVKEETQTSLCVARCLQAHENVTRWTPVAAWSGEPGSEDTLTCRADGSNPRLLEEEPELQR